MHCAKVSHAEVWSEALQGWPSGMMVGHVPAGPVFPLGQLPTRHRMAAPHGCPALAQVTVVHWWVVKSQSRPVVHSAALMQGAPTAPAAWHVDGPLTAGQTSGAAHS